jgi:cytochrome c peroxidase
MIRWLAAAAALLAAWAAPAAAETLDFSAEEIAQIARHGPWPPPFAPDPSNRASGQPPAIALGEALFFDRRLAPDQKLSCASCHEPDHGWAEAKPVSDGRARLTRNAIGLLDARTRRWFGWDGGQDSLWAMSLRPIIAPLELAATPESAAALLRADEALGRCYAAAFGRPVEAAPPDALMVDLAKALAAFQETLTSRRSQFDDFRDALLRGAATDYPPAAQRGLRLFIGRGNCALCHLGPDFSNGEFHDVAVPFFTPDGVDPGRHAGIKTLQASPYNLLGRWNDDPVRATGQQTQLLDPQHRNFGEFRTPSLRNLSQTAPYMHDGSKATLRDVVRHYSEIDPDRLHADGEAILRPLGLTDPEIDDLVAFLASLDGGRTERRVEQEFCR